MRLRSNNIVIPCISSIWPVLRKTTLRVHFSILWTRTCANTLGDFTINTPVVLSILQTCPLKCIAFSCPRKALSDPHFGAPRTENVAFENTGDDKTSILTLKSTYGRAVLKQMPLWQIERFSMPYEVLQIEYGHKTLYVEQKSTFRWFADLPIWHTCAKEEQIQPH